MMRKHARGIITKMIQPAKKARKRAKNPPQAGGPQPDANLPAVRKSVSIKGGEARPGKPAHVPTEQTRKIVGLALLAGFSHADTARELGISLSTLQKHYQPELESGGKSLLIRITATLARIATDVNHPKAVTAAIFWLKTKGGFKEDGPPTGEDSRPQKVTFTINIGGTGPKRPGDGAKVIDA